MNDLSDEEIAARIVGIYFKEIARLGFKRGLSLDEVINSYYYTLSRLSRKETEMKKAVKKVVLEEKEISHETKEELLPAPGN
jgi:hypothetical protein